MTVTKIWAVPALLALVLAAGAHAADEGVSIDQALRRQAPEVLKYLRAKKYKNVAVLKFRAAQGDGPLRDDLGLLNRTLADRLEVALVLGLTDEDDGKLRILTHASDAVAAAGDRDLTHVTPEGRQAFFTAGRAPLFKPAWGRPKPVPADAFLTGEAVVAPDWRTVRIRVQAFDRDDAGDKELHTAADWFTAACDPRTLTECDVSYAHKKGAKDDEDDSPKQQTENLAMYTPPAPELPPPSRQVEVQREKAWDELMNDSAVKLDILYNDKPVKVVAGAVPTPGPNDVVTFHLKNTDDKVAYGVVLKVNGESTIEHQKMPALECYKWVLAPHQEITVDGFQAGDEKAQQFKVLPPEESKGAEINYGDNAGVFSLVVFREAMKEETAFVHNDAKRNQEVKAISRGALIVKGGEQPPRSLKALQDELSAEADPGNAAHEGTKGLIVAGTAGDSKIEHRDFTPYPREMLSLVVRYYEPKK